MKGSNSLDKDIGTNINSSGLEKIRKKSKDIIEQDSGDASDGSDDGMIIDDEERTRKRRRSGDGAHNTSQDAAPKRQRVVLPKVHTYNYKAYEDATDQYENISLKGLKEDSPDEVIRVDEYDDFRVIEWRYGVPMRDVKLKFKDCGIDEDEYEIENAIDWPENRENEPPELDESDTWGFRKKNRIYCKTMMHNMMSWVKLDVSI